MLQKAKSFHSLSFLLLSHFRCVGTCASLFIRTEGNKAYPLKLGSDILPVYCHMTDDLGACGIGGWMMVMKIDGKKVFHIISQIILARILTKYSRILIGSMIY